MYGVYDTFVNRTHSARDSSESPKCVGFERGRTWNGYPARAAKKNHFCKTVVHPMLDTVLEHCGTVRQNSYLRFAMTNWKEHIVSDPAILFGKMVVKGTRVPAELILEKLALGNTLQELIEAYPRITQQDILACLSYASENAKHEKTLAVDV